VANSTRVVGRHLGPDVRVCRYGRAGRAVGPLEVRRSTGRRRRRQLRARERRGGLGRPMGPRAVRHRAVVRRARVARLGAGDRRARRLGRDDRRGVGLLGRHGAVPQHHHRRHVEPGRVPGLRQRPPVFVPHGAARLLGGGEPRAVAGNERPARRAVWPGPVVPPGGHVQAARDQDLRGRPARQLRALGLPGRPPRRPLDRQVGRQRRPPRADRRGQGLQPSVGRGRNRRRFSQRIHRKGPSARA